MSSGIHKHVSFTCPLKSNHTETFHSSRSTRLFLEVNSVHLINTITRKTQRKVKERNNQPEDESAPKVMIRLYFVLLKVEPQTVEVNEE